MRETVKVHTYCGETDGVKWMIRAIEHQSGNEMILKGGIRAIGHYCAYVEVPKDLAEWFENEVPIHGGVTWGGEHGTNHTNKYPCERECTEGCEVLGWDYHHYYDDEWFQTYEMIEKELLESVKLLVEKMGVTE